MGLAQHPDEHNSAGQSANLLDLVSDAKNLSLRFCRDFRALDQLNYDRDCSNTRIKHVQKTCKEAKE